MTQTSLLLQGSGSSATWRPYRRRDESPTISNNDSAPRSRGGFQTFSLDGRILRGIRAAGFEEPRPIQSKTIPAVLKGRDVLGLAQTGTGKTAAFALPMISNLLEGERRGKAPRALILAPTRELAMQIEAEFSELAAFTPVRSTSVFGGVPIPRQIRALMKGPDVLVACPGRLLDLHQRRAVDLRSIEILVLDEADHMFDMGFLPDIRRILAALPDRRQNLLFSATMPKEIRHLTDNLLHKPHVVELQRIGPADTIEHALYPVDDDRKQDLLLQLLGGPDFSSAIVFLRTKSRAKRLAQRLDRHGRAAIALQGNMSQGQRERAMQGFRDGRYNVLVATDIAARGIDVQGISHVVNYDVPHTADAYTHRIGRTGRSEQTGKACTFVTKDDRVQVKAIEKHLGEPIERVTLEGFGWSGRPNTSAATRSSAGSGRASSGRSNWGRGSGSGGQRRAGNGGSSWGGGSEGAGSKGSSKSKGGRRKARRAQTETAKGGAKPTTARSGGARSAAKTGGQSGRKPAGGRAFGAGVEGSSRRGSDRNSRPGRDLVRS